MECLQSELAKLQLTENTERSERARVKPQKSEKQRTEERLKRLIQRCDMYVRRHQMLKEMGISIKYT